MDLKRRLRLFVNVLAIVAILIAAKLAVHHLGLEFLVLDSLFSSVIAGTIFIIGFLLTSTLPDFKEAERLPAEIRVALEAIRDDVAGFAQQEPRAGLRTFDGQFGEILAALERGLGPEGHHDHLEEAIAKADALAPLIADLDRLNMANNYIVRLRGHLDALRRSLYRISYIQKVEFVPSVRVLIQSLVTAMLFLLLCLKTDGSVGTSLLFGFASYLFVFAMHLIAVFEQPFRQGEHAVDKVSLYLLKDFAAKQRARLG